MFSFFLFCLSACTNKAKKEQVAPTQKQDTIDANGVQRMQASHEKKDIKFKGKIFHVSLNRTPNDSLPRVKTDAGDTFADNQITLHITGSKGQFVFSKTFTKRSFSSLVEEDFLTRSVLEGMVFDKVTPKGLVFAASICFPETDLYVPVSVTITSDGTMSMVKEEVLEDLYSED